MPRAALTQKEFVVSDSDSILAYETANAIEAHALVAFLANEGVEARVLGEALQGAFGGIEAGTLDTIEVWVAAADRAKAEPLIEQWRQEYDEPKA
jgi:hypothetical protein